MIKQVIARNYCLGCHGCCRFSGQDSVWLPHLLEKEVQELLKKDFSASLISWGIGKYKTSPTAKIAVSHRRRRFSCDKKIRSIPHPAQNNFICSFLQPKDNKCKIYAFRPFECWLYPFLINRKGEEVFLALDLKCPFVKENLESQKFKRHIRYLIKFFNSLATKKILKNNPQIIQIYEDVLNLAELNPAPSKMFRRLKTNKKEGAG